MVGVGAGLLILSECFVLNNNTLLGLNLLNASVSLLNVLPLQVTCFCRALNASVKVGISKLLYYGTSTSTSTTRVQSLLTSANMEHGIYRNNVWGMCAQGAFLDDLFRRRFLEVLGIRSCFCSYLDKLNKTIAKAACNVASGLSSEFLSLIENG